MSKNFTITPVILCGGDGSRLWPLSNFSKPKQFISLPGVSHTLLQNTLLRLKDIEYFNPPVLIMQQQFIECAEEQLHEIDVKIGRILLESHSNGTAFAIATAALWIQNQSYNPENELILILPVDHYLDDPIEFFNNVQSNACNAFDKIIMFGMIPQRLEYSYGYIQVKNDAFIDGFQKIEKFIEKPNESELNIMMQKEFFYWNSGILFASAKMLTDAIEQFCPEHFAFAKNAVNSAVEINGKIIIDGVFIRDKKSIDKAIIEKSDNVFMQMVNVKWHDIGYLHSAWELSEKDQYGNFSSGNAFLMDTQNSYIVADHKPIAVIGLNDVVVINADDAILIADKTKSSSAKELYYRFKNDSLHEQILDRGLRKDFGKYNDVLNKHDDTDKQLMTSSALKFTQKSNDIHNKSIRPWGSFIEIERGENFAIKQLQISPFQRTSLQLHQHKSEHIIIIEGSASVIVDDNNYTLNCGDSIYIPQNAVHRIANNGIYQLLIIEVQIGAIISESDIIRIQDDYGRNV